MGRGPLFSVLLLLACTAQADERALRLEDGGTLHYRIVEDGSESAQPVARKILRYLAAGELEEAALLSNAPKRRYEVLHDYLAQVGEVEFKRVYGQYLFPENRVVAEVAIGPRRLVIWDLGEAGHHLAAQYYVSVDGRFLMDDAPSEERSQLRQVLRAFRAGGPEARAPGATSPARTD